MLTAVRPASLRVIFMATSYRIGVVVSEQSGMLAVLFSLLFLHLILVLRIFRLILPCEILPLFAAPAPALRSRRNDFSGSATLLRGPPARF
jgi:hypothetical protein